MRRALIVGATSAIAEATARILVERGDFVFLAGRNAERLSAIEQDLKVRGGIRLGTMVVDVNDFSAHVPLLDMAAEALGGIDAVLVAHGTLADQRACESSVELAMAEIRTNALSTIALLTEVANRFEAQRRGTIAAISSVAGDRGRQSNYIYGSSKAMITAFLSGLRQRLAKSGVDVITVKPGFVDTPMTAAFKKGFLWASADHVARGIVRAIDRGATVCYLPGFWRVIMFVIVHIPERIFRRLAL